MKSIKTTLIILAACTSLNSCAQMDAFLVKNTGLNSTDAILLGMKAKERIDLTLKEYNAAKNRNLPSGKEVVEVVVAPEPDPVSKPSMIDSVLSVFGF
jgi:hypothetical protein